MYYTVFNRFIYVVFIIRDEGYNMRLLLSILLLFSIALAQKPHIVLNTEIKPTLQYMKGGELTGVAVDIVKEVFKRADISYEIKVYPWARAMYTTETMENSGIFSIVRTPEREKMYSWSIEYLPYNSYYYSFKDSTKSYFENINEIEPDKKIILVRENVLHQRLKSEGIDEDKYLHLVNNFDEAFNLFINHKHNYYLPSDRYTFEYYMERLNYMGGDIVRLSRISGINGSLYLAFNNKIDPAIIESLEKSFNSMKWDGSYDKILSKWNLY